MNFIKKKWKNLKTINCLIVYSAFWGVLSGGAGLSHLHNWRESTTIRSQWNIAMLLIPPSFFYFLFFFKCPHPILIPDCCSTSSSCGVQRLSNADWPTLLLKYTGCNAKRVPPKLTRVWVPSFFIEYDYVPCSTERGGAQFTPAPVWLKLPPPTIKQPEYTKH